MRLTPNDIVEHIVDELALGNLGTAAEAFAFTRLGPGELLLDFGDAGRFTLVVAERDTGA